MKQKQVKLHPLARPDVWFAYLKKLNTDTNEENLEKIKHLTKCFANKNVSVLDKDISFMKLEKPVKYS